jgi:hypothetical protein
MNMIYVNYAAPSDPNRLTAQGCGNTKTFNTTNGWIQAWDKLIPGDYTVAEADSGL